MEKIKYFLKSLIGVLFFIVIMFIAAGRINYLQGIIYLSVSIFGLILNVITAKDNEELMKERTKPGENVKSWDKKILGLLALITLFSYILAGLDSGRYHWSPSFNLTYYLLGAVIVLIGQIIFLTAKNQNAFFSSVARIQDERQHSVCDVGMYSFVRHPGYLGMIISWLGFPIIMGSFYSIIPVTVAIILLIFRTYLEDKMLTEELNGYKEYKQKTNYRLIPYIW